MDLLKQFRKVLTIEGGEPRFHPGDDSIWLFVRKWLGAVPHLLMFAFLNLSHSSKRKPNVDFPPPAPSEPEIIKLQLGGEKPEGFIGLDKYDASGVDIVRDMERGLPFSDGTVAEVYISHPLLCVRDLIFVMNEIHRVCIPEATVRISVPTRESPLNFQDPTQYRVFDTSSFDFFTAKSAHLSRAKGVEGFYQMTSQTVEEHNKVMEIVLVVEKNQSETIRARKMDLGCGVSKKEGCVGLDDRPLEGVDIVRDIENRGLPFSDNTIEYTYTAHFLEHTEDLIFVMNEIHRVCCDNAIVEIIVPTLLSPHTFADPSHKRFFNVHAFQQYFEADFDEKAIYAGINKGFQVIAQYGSTSLHVTLRVLKCA